MIWFGAVGFGGQPGQPKPPTPWNDWRILKSSDKKKEFDHHFTSYLCLMRSTPQTLSNTIRAFFRLGAQKTHPNQLLDLDPKLPMFTTHHWLLFRRTLRSTRFFLFGAAKSQPRGLEKSDQVSGITKSKGQNTKFSASKACLVQKFSHPTFGSWRKLVSWSFDDHFLLAAWRLQKSPSKIHPHPHPPNGKKQVAFTKDPEDSQNYDQQLPGSFLFLRWGKKKRTTRRNLLGLLAPPEPCALDLPPSGRRFEKMDEHEKCWNHDFLMAVYHIYIYVHMCVCVFP